MQDKSQLIEDVKIGKKGAFGKYVEAGVTIQEEGPGFFSEGRDRAVARFKRNQRLKAIMWPAIAITVSIGIMLVAYFW